MKEIYRIHKSKYQRLHMMKKERPNSGAATSLCPLDKIFRCLGQVFSNMSKLSQIQKRHLNAINSSFLFFSSNCSRSSSSNCSSLLSSQVRTFSPVWSNPFLSRINNRSRLYMFEMVKLFSQMTSFLLEWVDPFSWVTVFHLST